MSTNVELLPSGVLVTRESAAMCHAVCPGAERRYSDPSEKWSGAGKLAIVKGKSEGVNSRMGRFWKSDSESSPSGFVG